MRLAIVASNLGRTVGRVHGHVAMQIPQEAFSAKNGMHLSKSTYHRSTPRTICLSSRNRPGRACIRAHLAGCAEFVSANDPGESRRMACPLSRPLGERPLRIGG